MHVRRLRIKSHPEAFAVRRYAAVRKGFGGLPSADGGRLGSDFIEDFALDIGALLESIPVTGNSHMNPDGGRG